jgi:uncharacterized membrane protein
MPVKRSADDGSLIPLIAFYFVVAATLILDVADASTFYLARRSLQGVADGAALAAAHSVSAADLYGGGGTSRLRLDGDVCQAVADYGNANDLASRFDQLAMSGYAGDQVSDCVANGADHVTVVARDLVKLPLVSILGVLDTRFAHGVQLTVVAHAALRCDTC